MTGKMSISPLQAKYIHTSFSAHFKIGMCTTRSILPMMARIWPVISGVTLVCSNCFTMVTKKFPSYIKMIEIEHFALIY